MLTCKRLERCLGRREELRRLVRSRKGASSSQDSGQDESARAPAGREPAKPAKRRTAEVGRRRRQLKWLVIQVPLPAASEAEAGKRIGGQMEVGHLLLFQSVISCLSLAELGSNSVAAAQASPGPGLVYFSPQPLSTDREIFCNDAPARHSLAGSPLRASLSPPERLVAARSGRSFVSRPMKRPMAAASLRNSTHHLRFSPRRVVRFKWAASVTLLSLPPRCCRLRPRLRPQSSASARCGGHILLHWLPSGRRPRASRRASSAQRWRAKTQSDKSREPVSSGWRKSIKLAWNNTLQSAATGALPESPRRCFNFCLGARAARPEVGRQEIASKRESGDGCCWRDKTRRAASKTWLERGERREKREEDERANLY